MIGGIQQKIVGFVRRSGLFRIKKDPNPIRWGVIGLGYMAEILSTTIDGDKGGVVYAVASRSLDKAQKFSGRHGHCKAYGSYEELVRDENLNLDIIYIATPLKYHYEHILLCLKAGKNVLCEKPITYSGDQLAELSALAKKNNCFFMEAMWMKCLPPFQKAQNWIQEGKIGDLELIKIDFYKRKQIRESSAKKILEKDSGVLLDFGVYAIAFLTHFLKGYPDVISPMVRMSENGLDTDWQISASKNGVKAAVNLSSNFGSLSKAALIGNNGTIEWESQFNRTNSVSLYDVDGFHKETYKIKYRFEGFEYQVQEVHNSLRQGKKESTIVTLDESQNTMKVIDELLISMI